MRTDIKQLLLAGIFLLGCTAIGNSGSVFAQENPDVEIVRTQRKRVVRTITIPDNTFRIVLTTMKNPGASIVLSIKALEGYEEGVWIDLNGNNRKDGDEEDVRFTPDKISYRIDNQTVTIYGKVTELVCSGNDLTALTISDFSFLERLDCASNQLAALDVNRCNVLKELVCDDNRLSFLKTGKMKALERISCRNNQLTTLDVKKTDALMQLCCSGNNFTDKKLTTLIKSLPDRRGRNTGTLASDCALSEEQKNRLIQKNWELAP